MIANILEFSQFEEGEVELNTGSVDLNRLMIRLLAENKDNGGAKEIRLISNLDQEMVPIECDEALVARMMTALISNAIKFTGAGGTVSIRSKIAGQWAEIEVKDTGIGMKDKDIQKAFLPFRQLGDVMSRAHEGSGLGLSLAQRIADMHGGKIDISSKVSEGTTATVLLPLRRD